MNANGEVALLNSGTPILVWSLVGAVLLLWVITSAVRIIGPDQRAVVIRLGRASRVRGPGLVVSLPGLERVQAVSVSPTSSGVVTVRGRTEEGIHVIMGVEGIYQIVDPLVAANTHPRAAAQLIDDLECIIQRELSTVSLLELLNDQEPLTTRLKAALNSGAQAWGITVLDVKITAVEAELDRELLRLMR